MKQFIIHRDADAEWKYAAEFYEERSAGLGREFVRDVSDAFERIQRDPLAHPQHKNTRVRKCIVARFPYLIFFVATTGAIWIVSVAHASRRPGYWRGRLPEIPD